MNNAAFGRKSVELECKLTSLVDELDAWLKASEEDQRLRKHHTQIRAVVRALQRPIDAAATRLEQARKPELLAEALELESMTLELHRIWDFFRQKLALRYVDHFADPLVAADELAWRCFEPAQALVPHGRGREPPLVYFSDVSSPLTIERDRRFRLAGEPLQWAFAVRAIEMLPVPVIGIPWFQLAHVPDAPIIAHEVGHDVEADLQLTGRIAELLIGAVPSNHRALWTAWAGEVFADVYGTVALGPAFATALVDFLSDDPQALARDVCVPGDGSTYPTAALRTLLVAEVLVGTGFEKEAEELRAALRVLVPSHAMSDYEADLEPVISVLTAGPYPQFGGQGLVELVGFGRDRHDRAVAEAHRLLDRMDPEIDDARELIAAARLAFDMDPDGYMDSGAGAEVARRIREKRGIGVRYTEPAAEGEAVADPREQRDAAAGTAMLALLDNHVKATRDVQTSYE